MEQNYHLLSTSRYHSIDNNPTDEYFYNLNWGNFLKTSGNNLNREISSLNNINNLDTYYIKVKTFLKKVTLNHLQIPFKKYIMNHIQLTLVSSQRSITTISPLYDKFLLQLKGYNITLNTNLLYVTNTNTPVFLDDNLGFHDNHVRYIEQNYSDLSTEVSEQDIKQLSSNNIKKISTQVPCEKNKQQSPGWVFYIKYRLLFVLIFILSIFKVKNIIQHKKKTKKDKNSVFTKL